MPFDSTPRMTPFSRTMPVPGICVPAGAKMPFMPVLALGAPQTTWITPLGVDHADPQPIGIGMFLASRTCATVKAQALCLVLDFLDLEADTDQPIDDLVERGIGVEVILQPREGEFHDSPPASVGTWRARKP